MTQYIYKLGHCPDLGVAEFNQLTNDNNARFNFQWLISEKKINVNQTGSLVFAAEVLQTFEESEKNRLLDYLDNYLGQDTYNKLGLFMHGIDSKQVFPIAKKHTNKATILEKIPNFGYWKQTNNWIVLVKFQSTLYLSKIISYSDQEFWSKLDDSLPCADMSRGIINLKLARSLINLSSNNVVWDNFAGQGRILVAGSDLKNALFASDIDERVIPQLQKNYEFATNFWTRNKYDKKDILKIANLSKAWVGDAIELENIEIINQETTANLDKSNLEESNNSISIVTEGFLGKNFKNSPDQASADEQVRVVSNIWKSILKNYENSNVTEIVGCLPFYPKLGFVPTYAFLEKEIGWNLIKLCKTDFIQYKRDSSNVGHLIFKLEKKI